MASLGRFYKKNLLYIQNNLAKCGHFEIRFLNGPFEYQTMASLGRFIYKKCLLYIQNDLVYSGYLEIRFSNGLFLNGRPFENQTSKRSIFECIRIIGI